MGLPGSLCSWCFQFHMNLFSSNWKIYIYCIIWHLKIQIGMWSVKPQCHGRRFIYQREENIWEGSDESRKIISLLISLIFHVICQYIWTDWWDIKKLLISFLYMHTYLHQCLLYILHICKLYYIQGKIWLEHLLLFWQQRANLSSIILKYF